MRVNSVKLTNFASYKDLKFDFRNQGLTLIEGPTGSGKSTLCDIIPWTVFGVTAKNGPVSDVLSWPGNEVCNVTVFLDKVTIARSRGPKPKDNDLMFWPVDGIVTRGKDLLDTQKLINNFLGMDADLYLAGAYYHEFSQTAQFFTTTAKARRLICEQIVDLNLAKTLQAKLIEKYKTVKSTLQHNVVLASELNQTIQVLSRVKETEDAKAKAWQTSHDRTKLHVSRMYGTFEKDRIKTIHNKCRECGTTLAEPKTVHNKQPNPYLDQLAQLETTENPHGKSATDYSHEIAEANTALTSAAVVIDQYKIELADLELLQQVAEDYRSASIQRTIQDIEAKTNQLLTDHFDAEIRIEFSTQDADKLDVQITKDGNTASFTQLSKGQRCILKLCFGVSVMLAIQNHHGVHIEQLMFDESLDGVDDSLKIKALKLFETLAINHSSVFLVEHSSEIKSRLDNKYTVSLRDGASVIEKT